jgi:hypothetical protein
MKRWSECTTDEKHAQFSAALDDMTIKGSRLDMRTALAMIEMCSVLYYRGRLDEAEAKPEPPSGANDRETAVIDAARAMMAEWNVAEPRPSTQRSYFQPSILALHDAVIALFAEQPTPETQPVVAMAHSYREADFRNLALCRHPYGHLGDCEPERRTGPADRREWQHEMRRPADPARRRSGCGRRSGDKGKIYDDLPRCRHRYSHAGPCMGEVQCANVLAGKRPEQLEALLTAVRKACAIRNHESIRGRDYIAIDAMNTALADFEGTK